MTILIPTYSDPLFKFKINDIKTQYPNEELIFFFTGTDEDFTNYRRQVFQYNKELEIQLFDYINQTYKCYRQEGLSIKDLLYVYLIKYKQGVIYAPSMSFTNLLRWPCVYLKLNKDVIVGYGFKALGPYHLDLTDEVEEMIKNI